MTSEDAAGSDGLLKSQYPKISSSWDLVVITDKNISSVILIAIVEDLSVFIGCWCGFGLIYAGKLCLIYAGKLLVFGSADSVKDNFVIRNVFI